LLAYFRYLLVIILLGLLFYPYTITITKELIDEAIAKKIPIVKEKKGFILTIDTIEIEDIINDVIFAKAMGNIKMSASNRMQKFLKKYVNTLENKSIKVSVVTQIRPKIKGFNLSFDILALQVNSLIKQKKLNKYVREKLGKVEIPIKKLKKISWLVTVQELHFDSHKNLDIYVNFSVFIIVFLIVLLLFREIQWFSITFYQKFFSLKGITHTKKA